MFGISAASIPHPIFVKQSEAVQPRLLTWLVLFFFPGHALTLVTYCLIRWPAFVELFQDHRDAYYLIFFAAQVTLITASLIFVATRYGAVTLKPRPAWSARHVWALLIFLPLLIFYMRAAWIGFQGNMRLVSISQRADYSPEIFDVFEFAYNRVWGAMPYGTDLTGMVCFTTLTLLGPFYEELVFSGLALNILSKRCGIPAGFVLTAVCFTLLHIISFGFGLHLVPLFFSSLVYGLLRIVTGSLFPSVVAHCAINFLVMAPKWMLAILYFTTR